GSSSQPRTDPPRSSINAFSIEELYTPEFSESLQENTSYWHQPNAYEAVGDQVTTSPTKKKATHNSQKRSIQTTDAPRQTMWTTGKKLRWLKESGARYEDYVQKAMIHYEHETEIPFRYRHCWGILKDGSKFQEIAFPNFNQGSEGSSKRHKSSGSSSFCINLNTTVVDEDEVQEIRRPCGSDKARAAAKNKGSKASGSLTMNDDAFARLMVNEMTAAEVEQCDAFMKLKRREQKSKYAKRLENKKAEQLTQSQSGTMDNYVIKIPHVSSSNNEDVGDGNNNDEYVDEDSVNNTDVNNEDVDDVKLDYDDDGVLGLILIMTMLRMLMSILIIISAVKFLAKHNLAFRVTNEKLYKKSNKNFLSLIEMLQEFNPVIKEHVRRITRDDMHVHYLGHTIENELILLLAREIKSEIIKKTRVTIEQSFMGFLNVDETTEKRLFDDELKSFDLDIDDVRGQEALLQHAKSDNDFLIQSQAKSLATKELGDFELLVAIVIWFEILYAVNLVSKKLQSNDMIMDIAIKEVKGLISFFEKLRETGLSKAINDAKEIVVEMDIDPVFIQKHLKSYDDKSLKLSCSQLEATLKNDERLDIDANELFIELSVDHPRHSGIRRKKFLKTEIAKVLLKTLNVTRET
nr:hypothetical protein [Tanacetum cinerariifolium]